MERIKQTKAKNAVTARTETLTFRLSKRLRALAEIAARGKGTTLANHVERALESSLNEPHEFLRGASIAAVGDLLYDEDEATCFLKRITSFPWAMDSQQKRLFDLMRVSKMLHPQWGIYREELIKQYWSELNALADGSDDLRALPPEMFEDVDIEFALMNDEQRIALYQRDPEGCARRTQTYMRRTKQNEETL